MVDLTRIELVFLVLKNPLNETKLTFQAHMLCLSYIATYSFISVLGFHLRRCKWFWWHTRLNPVEPLKTLLV